MSETPDTLFDLDELDLHGDQPFTEVLREVREFSRVYKEVCGLLTPAQTSSLLNVSGARVRQMIQADILETRTFSGIRYITGRSVAARLAEDPPKKGGRPKTHLSLGDRLKFFANAVRADAN